MNHTLTTFATAFTLLMAAPVFAQAPKAAHPPISKQQATQIALEAVPGGHIKSAELEHEGGKYVWSFDITRHNVSGATEIQVDAKSGDIVSRKEESSAEEAKEAQADKAETPRAHH